jgi:homoserine O-succinyltransferase
MAYHLDPELKRDFYPQKLFGVYRSQLLVRKEEFAPHPVPSDCLHPTPGAAHNSIHPIVGDLDDLFDCPQSRYSRINDAILLRKQAEGKLNLLAHSPEPGYFLFETPDHRFVMHLGHPEYNRGRLIDEYNRDLETGLTDVAQPANFDLQDPLNTWRGHRNEFFGAWIKYLYLENEF